MVSATQQSSRIRQRKQTTQGKWNKRSRRAHGTPVFPIHQPGYDPTAADAAPAAASAASSTGKLEPSPSLPRELHGQPRIRRKAQPSARQEH
jgi:hypothetical protein